MVGGDREWGQHGQLFVNDHSLIPDGDDGGGTMDEEFSGKGGNGGGNESSMRIENWHRSGELFTNPGYGEIGTNRGKVSAARMEKPPNHLFATGSEGNLKFGDCKKNFFRKEGDPRGNSNAKGEPTQKAFFTDPKIHTGGQIGFQNTDNSGSKRLKSRPSNKLLNEYLSNSHQKPPHPDSEDTANFRETNLNNTTNHDLHRRSRSPTRGNVSLNSTGKILGKTHSSKFLERVSEKFDNMRKMSTQLSTSKMLVLVRTVGRALSHLQKIDAFENIFNKSRVNAGLYKVDKVFYLRAHKNQDFTMKLFTHIKECFIKEKRGLRVLHLIVAKGIAVRKFWALTMIMDLNKQLGQKRDVQLEFILEMNYKFILRKHWKELLLVNKLTNIMVSWGKRENRRFQEKLWKRWVLLAKTVKQKANRFAKGIARVFKSQSGEMMLRAFTKMRMIGSKYKMFGILLNKKLRITFTEMRLALKKMKLLNFYIGNFSDQNSVFAQSHCPDFQSRAENYSTRNSIDPRPWAKSATGGYPFPKFSKSTRPEGNEDAVSKLSSPGRFVAFNFVTNERHKTQVEENNVNDDLSLSNLESIGFGGGVMKSVTMKGPIKQNLTKNDPKINKSHQKADSSIPVYPQKNSSHNGSRLMVPPLIKIANRPYLDHKEIKKQRNETTPTRETHEGLRGLPNFPPEVKSAGRGLDVIKSKLLKEENLIKFTESSRVVTDEDLDGLCLAEDFNSNEDLENSEDGNEDMPGFEIREICADEKSFGKGLQGIDDSVTQLLQDVDGRETRELNPMCGADSDRNFDQSAPYRFSQIGDRSDVEKAETPIGYPGHLSADVHPQLNLPNFDIDSNYFSAPGS
jgi:hypothetical protein